MQDDNNRSYYAARAAKERKLAEQAEDAAIRQIHAEMATRYDLLVLGEQPSARSQQATATG